MCLLLLLKQIHLSYDIKNIFCYIISFERKRGKGGTHLSVTMIAEGCAQAVMSVTMKRKMRKVMSVPQVRSHLPASA